jgi:hypothetical protein
MALGRVAPLGSASLMRGPVTPVRPVTAGRGFGLAPRLDVRPDGRDEALAGRPGGDEAAHVAAAPGFAARALLRWQLARHALDEPPAVAGFASEARPAPRPRGGDTVSRPVAQAAAIGLEASGVRPERETSPAPGGAELEQAGVPKADPRQEALTASLLRDPARLFTALQRLREHTLETTLGELGAMLTAASPVPSGPPSGEGVERLRAFTAMAPRDGVQHLLDGLRKQGVPLAQARARVAAVVERMPLALWSADQGRPADLRMAAIRECRGLDESQQAAAHVGERLRIGLALGTTLTPTRSLGTPRQAVSA